VRCYFRKKYSTFNPDLVCFFPHISSKARHSNDTQQAMAKKGEKTVRKNPHSVSELMYHRGRCRSLRQYTFGCSLGNISNGCNIFCWYISICMRSREAESTIPSDITDTLLTTIVCPSYPEWGRQLLCVIIFSLPLYSTRAIASIRRGNRSSAPTAIIGYV
jgi:hypothetical protein